MVIIAFNFCLFSGFTFYIWLINADIQDLQGPGKYFE